MPQVRRAGRGRQVRNVWRRGVSSGAWWLIGWFGFNGAFALLACVLAQLRDAK